MVILCNGYLKTQSGGIFPLRFYDIVGSNMYFTPDILEDGVYNLRTFGY